MREANARATELNVVLDAMSDGVMAWTANGLITHLNDQAGQLLGLSPTTVVGRRYPEFMHLPQSFVQAAARVISVDVRVIVASDFDLEVLAEEGAFRADLFFRLSSFAS